MNAHVATVNGIDIFVDERGKFSAVIEGKAIKRSSLSSVTSEIRKRGNAVTAFEISDSNYEAKRIVKREVIEYLKYSQVRLKDGELCHLYGGLLFVLDESEIDQVQRLIAEQNELDYRWRELLSTFKRVTSKNLEELQQKAVTR